MFLIETPAEYRKLDLNAIKNRPRPSGVLMCTPEYFDIIDVKNYFMRDAVGSVDRTKAKAQWESLRQLFMTLGLRVDIINGQPGLEDMVFAANAGLCWVTDTGEKIFFASTMMHESRKRETPYYIKWLAAHGYRIVGLESGIFEGGGDAVWHPEKSLLFGGYGHRTTKEAYDEIVCRWDIPIIILKLVSDEFYHLDTALCIMDKQTVLYCPEAFDDQGNALLEVIFSRRIHFTKKQGINYFIGNAFCVNEKNIVLQQGDIITVKKLHEFGYHTHEIDLSEFIKSGGNVSCLKLDIY